MRHISRFLLTSLALLVALSLAGCENKVTLENYEQIEVKVTTLTQAQDLLGTGRDETGEGGRGIDSSGMVSSGGKSTSVRTYVFEGEGGAMVVLQIDEDSVVISKRQTGLQ